MPACAGSSRPSDPCHSLAAPSFCEPGDRTPDRRFPRINRCGSWAVRAPGADKPDSLSNGIMCDLTAHAYSQTCVSRQSQICFYSFTADGGDQICGARGRASERRHQGRQPEIRAIPGRFTMKPGSTSPIAGETTDPRPIIGCKLKLPQRHCEQCRLIARRSMSRVRFKLASRPLTCYRGRCYIASSCNKGTRPHGSRRT